MSNEILVALIGLDGSAIGSLCGVLVSSKLKQYRIEQLEKKVEKHNNLVERTYQLEQGEELLGSFVRTITTGCPPRNDR